MLININKESLIVQQAYFTANGDVALNNKDLIIELSGLLAKHFAKAVMIIKNGVTT